MIRSKKEEPVETCSKCGAAMTKRGVIESGHSKYNQMVCKSCGNTQLRCIGVLN